MMELPDVIPATVEQQHFTTTIQRAMFYLLEGWSNRQTTGLVTSGSADDNNQIMSRRSELTGTRGEAKWRGRERESSRPNNAPALPDARNLNAGRWLRPSSSTPGAPRHRLGLHPPPGLYPRLAPNQRRPPAARRRCPFPVAALVALTAARGLLEAMATLTIIFFLLPFFSFTAVAVVAVVVVVVVVAVVVVAWGLFFSPLALLMEIILCGKIHDPMMEEK